MRPSEFLEEYYEKKKQNAQLPQQEISDEKTSSEKYQEYKDWLNEIPEISDEEIEKAIDAYFPKTDINARWGWKLGAEWYREQLKTSASQEK